MSFGQYSIHEKPLPPTKPAREKKLKAVFDTSEVAHVFANPREEDGSGFEQTHARNPQHNFFFNTSRDGVRILYSYRDSYPVASRFIVGKGKHAKPVFLIRSGKPYSVTTSCHMNMAGHAVPSDAIRFDVPLVTDSFYSAGPSAETHAANLADIVERIGEALAKYINGRAAYTIESEHASAVSLTDAAKRYAKLFRIKLPKLPKIPTFDAQRVADARARRAHLDATRDAREAQRNAEALKRAEADIAAWKRGESVTPSWGWNRLTPYALLRVLQDAQTGLHSVETSQGVRVPVGSPLGAARLLRFLESLKASGRTYQKNGHSEHIGQFTVTSFDGSILTAGCHRIEWSGVLSIADAVRIAAEKDAEREARTNDEGSYTA
jgi:hypothetical protein